MLGQSAGDKQMVMDIKLKKQYSIGWIGNVEAGGGTAERYLAKLFGMRFTNHSRLSFYGSLNNVNEFRRPGENTDWTPEMVGDGLTTVRFGGIDYFINDRQKRFKLEGSAVVRHNDDTYNNRTSSVNFLSGGDTYGLSASRSRYHSFSFFTSHDWLFKWQNVRLRIQPDAYYERSQRNAFSRAAVCDVLPTSFIAEGALDSLFRPDLNTALLGHTLYRKDSEGLTKGRAFNVGLSTMTTIKIPHTMDNVIIEAGARVTDNKYRILTKSKPTIRSRDSLPTTVTNTKLSRFRPPTSTARPRTTCRCRKTGACSLTTVTDARRRSNAAASTASMPSKAGEPARPMRWVCFPQWLTGSEPRSTVSIPAGPRRPTTRTPWAITCIKKRFTPRGGA